MTAGGARIALAMTALTGMLAGVAVVGLASAPRQAADRRPEEAAPAPSPPDVAPPAPQPAEVAPQVKPPPQLGGLQFRSPADPFAPWPDDGRETLLTFVILADPQVGRGDDGATLDRVIDAVNVLAPEPAFVIMAGDITDHFKLEQIEAFKASRARLRVPSHLVPGNHDESFDPDPAKLRSWARHFPDAATPWRHDYGPLAIIGFDSQLFNERRRSTDADAAADKELAQLTRKIKAARADGKRVWLLHHIPPYPNFFRAKLKRAWQTRYLSRYRRLLRAHPVEVEVTGHFHRDELYVEDGAILMNVPPVSQKFTRDASYRIVRVTADGFNYRQLYLAPELRHLTYEVDLHGLDEPRFETWVKGLSRDELIRIWHLRNAGDDDAEGWLDKLVFDHFRAFILSPYAYQPPGTGKDTETVHLEPGIDLR